MALYTVYDKPVSMRSDVHGDDLYISSLGLGDLPETEAARIAVRSCTTARTTRRTRRPASAEYLSAPRPHRFRSRERRTFWPVRLSVMVAISFVRTGLVENARWEGERERDKGRDSIFPARRVSDGQEATSRLWLLDADDAASAVLNWRMAQARVTGPRADVIRRRA
jgi:hypothetical protein